MLEFPVMSTSRLHPVAFVAEVEGAANHPHSLIPSRPSKSQSIHNARRLNTRPNCARPVYDKKTSQRQRHKRKKKEQNASVAMSHH
jgi:hypothetical protein